MSLQGNVKCSVDDNLKFCGSNAHCEMVTLPHFASFNDREGLVGVVFDLVQNTKHRVDGTTNLLLCERKCYLRHISYILGRNVFTQWSIICLQPCVGLHFLLQSALVVFA